MEPVNLDSISSDIDSLLGAHIQSKISESDRNILIIKLCQSIEHLREELKWYGDENHIVNTWYQREDKELCKLVESSHTWRHMRCGDNDEYVENGFRAEKAIDNICLPENIVNDLLNEEGL